MNTGEGLPNYEKLERDVKRLSRHELMQLRVQEKIKKIEAENLVCDLSICLVTQL